MLSRTLQQGATVPDFEGSARLGEEGSPFKSIDVLVVPENVTKLAKTMAGGSEPPSSRSATSRSSAARPSKRF